MAGLDKKYDSEKMLEAIQALNQRISDFILEDDQISTEDRYQSSDLRTYLELDSWESEDALLLLCGIDPQGSNIDHGYENHIGVWVDCEVINHAYFFGEKYIYDFLTPMELKELELELETISDSYPDLTVNELNAHTNEILNKYTREEVKHIVLTRKISEKIGVWRSDENVINLWSIREKYGDLLTRRKKLWKSGNHQSENPVSYYIDWAVSKGVEIPWLEWAISEGLLPAGNTNAIVENPDDSNPLSIFRSMNSLRFEEVTIKVDPVKFMLEITARGAKVRVPFSAIGIMKKNEMTITRSGEILLEMARSVYTLNKRDSSALKRLSEILRFAFQTSSTPVAKGKPNFKLTIPKDKEAKFNASRKTVQFNDNSAVARDDADEFLRNSDDQYDPDNPTYSDHD